MSRLWDKGKPLDQTIAQFTVGRDPELDLHLVAYDALGSAAHATMLQSIGVLTATERNELIGELRAIKDDALAGTFKISLDQEDCHTAIENRLTEKLGDAGRKIHTGRSRNDQVIAAVRLYARERLLDLVEVNLATAEKLLDLAETHRDTSVPGYTHTRQAMPSTLGLFFSAYAEGLLDAHRWLETAFSHVNRSPLGSASGFGVALPLDRQLVADLLHFDGVQRNTLAVQNDRGHTEWLVLGAALTSISLCGRLAHDLIWYSSDELGYMTLADNVTTGSSIMPQKRNPDVLELIRAQAGKLRGRHTEIAAIYAPIGTGYHRDLQLTKEPFVEGLEQATAVLVALNAALDGLNIDSQRCADAVQRATAATDEVYRRVTEGTPFRTAYREVGADANAFAGEPHAAWQLRKHLGAAGALDLSPDRARHQQAGAWLSTTRGAIGPAWDLLTKN